MSRRKISNAPEKDSFLLSFIPVDLRRELKKISRRQEKTRYRIVKIISSLECAYSFQGSGKEDYFLAFQSNVNRDTKEQ